MVNNAVKRTLIIVSILAVSVVSAGAANPSVTADPAQLVEDTTAEAQIEGYLSGLGATYGVAAANLQDGSAVFVNADTSFPMASMYKLLVMYRVFQAVSEGRLSTDGTITVRRSDVVQQEPSGGFYPGDTPTVRQALTAMITISSNSAGWALTRYVGGWNYVSSAADELGMPRTGLTNDFWTTPNDMAHYFRLLAGRSLVSPEASDQMIDLLLQQTVNNRIPVPLPPAVEVAHKTGELDGVRNDGGIVLAPTGPYVLVLMSRNGDPDEEVLAEQELSRMVYTQYMAVAQ